ncbi:unnamed protein product, partial [marine sediment metagenome]
MSGFPMKRTGFQQPLLATSATQKEMVGTLRITRDGRKFRYAKNGAGALAAGKANIVAAADAEVFDEVAAATHAIGDMIIEETITAGVIHAENKFRGGFFAINEATGEGHQYMINSSSAVAVGGTAITLGLSDPIRVAVVAAVSYFTIVVNPQYGVAESAVEENLMAGVAPLVVPIGNYFWNQTGGVALVLCDQTPVVGTVATLGDPAGSMAGIQTALDVDMAQCYGVFFGQTGVDGEYTQIY